MDILAKLARTDRYETLGNRMTSYSSTLGGGSLNYWDGNWDNDANDHPRQMLAVFEQNDGRLTLRRPNGEPIEPQLYAHRWQPDAIRSNYLAHDRLVLKETKGICDDVWVSEIEITNSVQHANGLTLCREGTVPRGTSARILGGRILHLHASRHPLKGIHRLIAFAPEATTAQADGRRFSLTLDVPMPANRGRRPRQRCVYCVIAMGVNLADTRRRLKRALRRPRVFLDRTRRQWRDYFENCVPEFRCSDPRMEKFFYHSYYVARGNLIDLREGSFTEPYTCPSKLRLLPQWFWDMAFHAIHEKWTRGMPFPKSCIRNCLNAQHSDGHLIFMHVKKGDGDFLRQLGWPARIQPFILPMAVWDIYLAGGDRGFLRECLPRLVAFDLWMRRSRDPRHEWLVNLEIPGESGWDNSKRFVPKGAPLTPDACGRHAIPIQPVDFNTYVYIGRWLIRRMARELGDHWLAASYKEAVDKTAEAIRAMYSPRLGMYADKFVGEPRLSSIKSAGGLIPLLAGLAKPDQAASVVRHLLNPKEFWSRYPIPTLSMDDPDFTCADGYQSYWNGRTWANVDWLVLEGLVRNGQSSAASQLLGRLLELGVNRGEPYMTENFHPLKPYAYDLNQNIMCYGWSGLIADAMIRRAVGIQPNIPRHTLVLNPMLPDGVDAAAVEKLHLGPHTVGVSVERAGKTSFRVRVTHRGRKTLTVVGGIGRRTRLQNGACDWRVRTWRAPHWLDM